MDLRPRCTLFGSLLAYCYEYGQPIKASMVEELKMVPDSTSRDVSPSVISRDATRQMRRPPVQPVVPAPAAAPPQISWEEGAAIVEADAIKNATKIEMADDDEDVRFWVDMRLREQADEWPGDAPPPPETDEEVLDPEGPWSASACGVEIKLCDDDPAKGFGAFAVRNFAKGSMVGLYWGEVLTQREHALRHGWRSQMVVADATREEKAALKERSVRLAAISYGAPVHGASNGSSYCFNLLPEEVCAALGSAFLPRHAAYIDGEDPNRSSWGRFVNHCSEFSKSGVVGTGCNLEPRIDGAHKLVWFEAKRDIEPGEEICFDYGASYRWDTPGTKGGPVRDENRWR